MRKTGDSMREKFAGSRVRCISNIPKQIIDYVTTGQLHREWVSTDSSVHIRRSDSIWLSVEDDDDWGEAKDVEIAFRLDPLGHLHTR